MILNKIWKGEEASFIRKNGICFNGEGGKNRYRGGKSLPKCLPNRGGVFRGRWSRLMRNGDSNLQRRGARQGRGVVFDRQGMWGGSSKIPLSGRGEARNGRKRHFVEKRNSLILSGGKKSSIGEQR